MEEEYVEHIIPMYLVTQNNTLLGLILKNMHDIHIDNQLMDIIVKNIDRENFMSYCHRNEDVSYEDDSYGEDSYEDDAVRQGKSIYNTEDDPVYRHKNIYNTDISESLDKKADQTNVIIQKYDAAVGRKIIEISAGFGYQGIPNLILDAIIGEVVDTSGMTAYKIDKIISKFNIWKTDTTMRLGKQEYYQPEFQDAY